MTGATSVAQSPQVSSAALSVSGIIRPATSIFTGQSPAPIYQVLPNLLEGSTPPPNAFPEQSTSLQSYFTEDFLQIKRGQGPRSAVQYRYRQADEERLRQELSTLEMLHENEDHPETLLILSELGQVLKDQGRYRSAEEIIRRLVKARQRVNGDDDINTLNAFDCLGKVLCLQGFYPAAEKIHRRTLESLSNILGYEHPNTLSSMANLAMALCEQGKWKEAEELEVQVIETRKKIQGQEHPHTLSSMANLAVTFGGKDDGRRQKSWGCK